MHLIAVYSSTSDSDKQEGGGEKGKAVKLFWKTAQCSGVVGGTRCKVSLFSAREAEVFLTHHSVI